MTTETEYQNAVNYLTRLLSGGLMGERGSKPLRIAIEACELQIAAHLEKLVSEPLPTLRCGPGRRLQRWVLPESTL